MLLAVSIEPAFLREDQQHLFYLLGWQNEMLAVSRKCGPPKSIDGQSAITVHYLNSALSALIHCYGETGSGMDLHHCRLRLE